MYLILWIFFTYAFLGWCTEVSYAALCTGHFVNRGFLNGPLCPIYGVGALIILACLTPLQHNLLLLFLGSVVLTSGLEWLTGFVLERLFHQRWWDYSDEPWNIGGYICLRFSVMWGIACLFVLKLLHPSILWLIAHIPHLLGLILLGLFSCAMAVDLAATVRTIVKMNRQLRQIDELAAKLKELSNEVGSNLAERVLDAVEKGKDLREDLADLRSALTKGQQEVREAMNQQSKRMEARLDELEQLGISLREAMNRPILGRKRLLHAFPRMRSTAHHQALEQLRRWLSHEK